MERKKILCFSSPFSELAVNELKKLNCPAYKIASADFTNYELIDEVASLGKLIFCSTQ